MCDYDFDFTYSSERIMYCRKVRRCCSCGFRIPPGEKVQRSFGSDGGTPIVDFRCQTCVWALAQEDGSFLHICDRELMDYSDNHWKHDYVRECLETGTVPSVSQAQAIGEVLGEISSRRFMFV